MGSPAPAQQVRRHTLQYDYSSADLPALPLLPGQNQEVAAWPSLSSQSVRVRSPPAGADPEPQTPRTSTCRYMSGGRRCWCRDSAPNTFSCRARIFLHAPGGSAGSTTARFSTPVSCACSMSVKAARSGRGAKVGSATQGPSYGLMGAPIVPQSKGRTHPWLCKPGEAHSVAMNMPLCSFPCHHH